MKRSKNSHDFNAVDFAIKHPRIAKMVVTEIIDEEILKKLRAITEKDPEYIKRMRKNEQEKDGED